MHTQPKELLALIDRITNTYDSPATFLSNWAGLIEEEADLLQAAPSGLINPARIGQMRSISAILQKAADEIDKVVGL